MCFKINLLEEKLPFRRQNTVKFRNKPQGLYFLKALFEGLLFGGAYLWREICVSKSIGQASYRWKEIYRFCFVLLCIWKQFPSTSPQQPRPHGFSIKKWVGPNLFFEEKPWGRGWSPQEAYIWRGDLTEAFWRYEFGGAYIWRGVYKEGLIFGILRYQNFSYFSGPGDKSYVLFSAKKPGENKLKYG